MQNYYLTRGDFLACLHENIRDYRKACDMTQDELAQKVGYKSRSSINKIEQGLADVSIEKLFDLSDALGVTPAQLLCPKDASTSLSFDSKEPIPDSVLKELRVSRHSDESLLKKQQIIQYLKSHSFSDKQLDSLQCILQSFAGE